MKNLLFVITIIALFGLNACNCGHTCEDIPEKVNTAFLEKFPDAKDVKWEQEDENEWEAEFKMDDKEYSANFTSDGNWKETEHEIEKSDLPKTVITTLETEFAGYDIEEAEISESPERKVFEIDLKKDESEIEVTVAPDGNVLNREVEEDEDNEAHHENDEEGEEDHHDNDDD